MTYLCVFDVSNAIILSIILLSRNVKPNLTTVLYYATESAFHNRVESVVISCKCFSERVENRFFSNVRVTQERLCYELHANI